METQKISNLLNKTDLDSKKIITRKWYIIDSLSTTYDEANSVKFDTKVIKPNICDYSEAYILITGTINNSAAVGGSIMCFKNCVPFRTCVSHINDEYLEETEFIDVVMPMYNLIEYSDNYEDSTGSLHHFKRDEITTENNANVDIANNSTSFTSRANLIGNNVNNVKLVVPLKYLSNFFRSLEMLLINCKIKLDSKLHAPIVTLSSKDTSHLSNLLSEGFKRSVFWNKYAVKRSMYNGDTRILLNASIQGVNRLFVLPFTAAADAANNLSAEQVNENNRNNYWRFYLPRTSITNYNVIDGRNFYDQPINSDERQYDELRKVTLGKEDDYTTGCFLDYAYFKRDYKIIAVDLSKQKELDADLRAIQQIEFTGTVANSSSVMTVLEESKETVLEFFKGTAKII